MACVLAVQRGWNPATDIKFNIIGDFKSLRQAVNTGAADVFMWEHFMTKPYWDNGELHFIDDITTPWPCFMLAGTVEHQGPPFLIHYHDVHYLYYLLFAPLAIVIITHV